VGRVSLRASQSDAAAFRQVFAGREYDLSDVPVIQSRIDAAYQAILDSGEVPIVVDAGANVGASAIWFSNRYPKAKVVAVEPDPGNFAVLADNVRGHPMIEPVQAAIGAERGFVTVDPMWAGWAARTTRAEQGVPIVTVEDCSKGGKLFFAKIDIEGFEKDLFASNTEWIDEAFVVAVEPHDWLMPGEFTSRPFMAELSKHPFEMIIKGENLIFVR
jgi:FkbM family methyltransferase